MLRVSICCFTGGVCYAVKDEWGFQAAVLAETAALMLVTALVIIILAVSWVLGWAWLSPTP